MSPPTAVPVPPVPPPNPPGEAKPQALSRRGQIAALVLLVGIAGLIGYRWYDDRYGTKPTTLQPNAAHLVDLNRATKSELMQVPGIGPAMAERIVLHREENGKFGRVEELKNVHGIGDATLNKIRPWLAIHPADVPDEPPPEPDRLTRKPTSGVKTMSKYQPSGGKININTATLAQLDGLPGIGKVLAQRIIDARDKKPFASVDELRRVSGIGPKKLEALRDLVIVGE
jgi:competence protein ComEA